MKKKKKYCCYCGKLIVQKDLEGKLRDYCPHCNTVFYENPLPVACSIVVNENREVLLVKRKKDPYKDMWCLPIGFAESGEEITEASLRELKEEAGIDGEIIRLIDVDTIDNYFYGHLAIVTYEVRKVSGDIHPGDDALEAAYFPIHDHPPLAWSSNEKAIKIYINLYKDTWAMIDSFKNLFPDINSIDEIASGINKPQAFLSNVLIKVIDKSINDISEKWEIEIRKKIPDIYSYINELRDLNKRILKEIQQWLQKSPAMTSIEEFIEIGKKFKSLHMPLPLILTAIALSRKSLWLYLVKEKILSSPLEIYTTLEINNRIIFFYDRINYYLSLGYFQE